MAIVRSAHNVLLLSAYPPGLHQYGIEKALRETGHRVFTAGSRGNILAELEQALQRHDPEYRYNLIVSPDESLGAILAKCPFQPDFILYLESGIPFLPQELIDAPCPVLGLLTEEHLHADWNNALFPYFDLALCTWRHTEENYRSHGRDNIVQWYYGARHSFCIDEGLERIYDVAFLGNLNPSVQRRRVATVEKILRLRDEGFNVYAGGSIFFREYNRVHCQSKIVYHDSITEQVNMRVFEAMGAGCLVIMRRPRDMTDLSSHFFQDREEIVYCDRDEEALALIRYYARHENERQRIAEAGRRKVTAEYNYTDVVRRLFEEVLPRAPKTLGESRALRLKRFGKDGRRQRLDYAWYYLSFGALDACINQIRAIGNIEEDSEALNLLGLCAACANQPDAAVRCLVRACECDPRAVLSRINLACVGIGFERQEAGRWWREALGALEAVDPVSLPAAAVEGPCYPPGYDRFRLEVSRAYFQYPAGHKRNTALLHLYSYRLRHLMGRFKLAGGLHREAMPDIEAAIGIIPDDGYVIHDRARVHACQGDWQKAVEDLKLAIELEPFFAQAQHDLAVSFERLGRTGEALEGYWNLVRRNPLFSAPAELWQRVGELALQIGRRPEALEAFEKALALKPGDKTLQQRVAELEGKSEKAPASVTSCQVSIVMAIDDEPHLVQRTIMSLLQHTAPSDACELLLIKRGSGKALDAFLSLLDGPLKVIPGSASLAADYAAAAERATGSFLVFINRGLAVQPGWLEPLLSSAADGHTISAPLLCDQSNLPHAAASAACFCLARDLWRRLGGLDRTLPLPQAVADLFLRLERQGGSVSAVPRSATVALSQTLKGEDSALMDYCLERRQALCVDEVRPHQRREPSGLTEPSWKLSSALERSLVGLVAGKRVLEIGGWPDLSPTALNSAAHVAVACRATSGTNGAPGHYRHHQADLREGSRVPLPWRDDSYDVSVADLRAMAEPAQALRELTRALRPEGRAWLLLQVDSFGPAALPASGQRLFGFLHRFFGEVEIFSEDGEELIRSESFGGAWPPATRVFALCAQPRKRQAGLTSIVIPAYNKLDYTKACLQHVREFTEGDYEVVVVDNGSADGTWSFLREQPGVRAVRLPENLGFPGAVNYGLEHARGEFLVVLSNDVLVPPGWLPKLLKYLRQDPKVGMVGPVTNYASGPQGIVTPALKTVEDFVLFARQYMTQSQPAHETHRLVGFLLAIRGDLVDAIGGLDPLFRPGNFEDDDFSLRARLAGFSLIMARDVFVYHFGSVTVRDERYAELLGTNWLKFKRKWGLPDSLGPENYGQVLPFMGSVPFSLPIAFVPLPYGEPAEVMETQEVVEAGGPARSSWR